MSSTTSTPRTRGGRERILKTAGRLFVQFGYAATSTRDIAQAVGIQQPSLYHHFSGKKEILTELLISTLGPSAARAQELAADESLTSAARLEALVRFDVELLCAVPNNLGILYLLPEVNTDDYTDSREARDVLKNAYRAFAEAAARETGRAAADPARAGEVVYFLVESVILRRAADSALDPVETAREITAVVRRIIGAE